MGLFFYGMLSFDRNFDVGITNHPFLTSSGTAQDMAWPCMKASDYTKEFAYLILHLRSYKQLQILPYNRSYGKQIIFLVF